MRNDMEIDIMEPQMKAPRVAPLEGATAYETAPPSRRGTRMTRRDMKVASQIAEYATPSIWGNPTVICVGSNAGV